MRPFVQVNRCFIISKTAYFKVGNLTKLCINLIVPLACCKALVICSKPYKLIPNQSKQNVIGCWIITYRRYRVILDYSLKNIFSPVGYYSEEPVGFIKMFILYMTRLTPVVKLLPFVVDDLRHGMFLHVSKTFINCLIQRNSINFAQDKSSRVWGLWFIIFYMIMIIHQLSIYTSTKHSLPHLRIF